MKISFIGGGNMATALISGISANSPKPDWIHVSEPNAEARLRLESAFPVRCFEQASEAIEGAQTIILAVKPQIMPFVLRELEGLVQPSQLVISIAAGITISTIQDALGMDIPVIRTMPNTPALIGKGISGLFAGPACSKENLQTAESVVSAAGASVWVETEDLINVVTAVSGSGPAYYFLLTEALREAGEKLGLNSDAAAKLALYTAYGSGEMAMQSEFDVTELRKRVTSPGGTTQAALDAFAADDFRQVVFRAVSAAVKRGEDLAAGAESS